jgi:hypothetical protein
MEKNPLQNQQGGHESQSEGHEGGSNVMSPPAFSLSASPVQRQVDPQAPVQRVQTPAAQPQAGGGMMASIGSFFSSIGEWFSNLFGGGGGTQQAGAPTAAPGNGPAAAPVNAPAAPVVAPVNAGPQNAGPVNATANAPVVAATVNVTNSVGVGGTNNPSDVRSVQDRLQTLGYLSAADFTAEQANASGTAPIAETAMPRTIVAISRYMMGSFGRPGLLIEPNQASNSFLNNNMATPLGNVGVGGDVGRGAQNNAADVRAVQLRLNALGKLVDPAYSAELVAATATGRIADTALVQTIAAINNFNITVVGSSNFTIRANSREQELLNNPPRYTAGTLNITNSVGTGGNNAATDVTSLQNRLVQLGFLTTAQRTAEAPASGAATVAVGTLTQTISAINQFQHAMNIAQDGLVVPGNETHRQMINPMLPEKTNVNLTGSVGRGGTNNRADVRRVQDRLQALGVLSTTHYLAERLDTAVAGNVALTGIPNTAAAIEKFCQTAAGTNDGRIDAGGGANRILNDPTHGSLTNFNLESNVATAGFNWTTGNAALTRVINAIEIVEAGNKVGEVPAGLINGAGVPASYGKAQVIGTSALDTIDGNQDMQDYYGLTDAMIQVLETRAAAAGTHYNDIYNNVPVGGADEATIQARIAAYTTAHGTDFVRDSGLGLDDIARMYHTANMKRFILADVVPRGSDTTLTVPAGTPQNQVSAVRQQIALTHITALRTNASFAASTNYLGMNTSSLQSYFRRTDNMGENSAGFKTKAIFNGPEGQRVRNAMTDNAGNAIGRSFIQQVYNSANGASGVPAATANRPRAVAGVTAYRHNHGGTTTTALANMGTDVYTQNMLTQWDANP